jgi:hypothetical protein
VHLKSGPIRGVSFGGGGSIRGGQLYFKNYLVFHPFRDVDKMGENKFY